MIKKISIIIPVYNGEKYISRCIDSVLNQKDFDIKDLEILLLNDGSKDNSLKILKKYASNYPEIIKVLTHKNMGVAKTRNKGIDLATGKYIMFIDQDDWINEDYCKILFSEIEQGDYDILLCGHSRSDSSNKLLYSSKSKTSDWQKYRQMSVWAKIHRLEFIRSYNIKFYDIYGEDVIFSSIEYKKTNNIGQIKYCGYTWFYNEKSVSNTAQKRLGAIYNDQAIKLLNALKKIYGDNISKIEYQSLIYIILGWVLNCAEQNFASDFLDTTRVIFKWLENNCRQYKLLIFCPPGGSVKEVLGLTAYFWAYRLNLIKFFSMVLCKNDKKMINFNSIKRAYKLNIPNIFTTPANISIPRVISCHLRWIATIMPLKCLLDLAYIVEHKNSMRIEKWVETNCADILANIDDEKINTDYPVNMTIWTCWWQGEKNAPDVVKKCILRIRNMSNGASVIVISQKNYQRYANIPDDLVKLHSAGSMSTAHFSDLLRTNILSERGGLWLDSTIWVHNLIKKECFHRQLYSVKFPTSPIIRADWGYDNIIFFMCIMGGRNRYFYKLVYDMLVNIWRNQPNAINYLFFDKVVRVLYRKQPRFKRYIDIGSDVDKSEIATGEIKLGDVVPEEIFKRYIGSRKYIKLTYKFHYPRSINGNKTAYGRILDTID